MSEAATAPPEVGTPKATYWPSRKWFASQITLLKAGKICPPRMAYLQPFQAEREQKACSARWAVLNHSARVSWDEREWPER